MQPPINRLPAQWLFTSTQGLRLRVFRGVLLIGILAVFQGWWTTAFSVANWETLALPMFLLWLCSCLALSFWPAVSVERLGYWIVGGACTFFVYYTWQNFEPSVLIQRGVWAAAFWLGLAYVFIYFALKREHAYRVALWFLLAQLTLTLQAATTVWLQYGSLPIFVIDELAQFALSQVGYLLLPRLLIAYVENLIYIDPLTGLRNRTALEHDLKTQAHQPHALLYIDIDDFGRINHNLGSDAGDAALQILTQRLQNLKLPGQLYRSGGDEFALMLSTPATAYTEALAQDIRNALQAPLQLPLQTISLEVSLGLSYRKASTERPASVINRAEAALVGAKQSPLGFATASEQPSDSYLDLEHQLRQAIAQGQLQAVFQPILHLVAQQPAGAEALCRWGSIPPARFIPLAERSRLILELDRLMLQQAIHKASHWNSGYVTVNVSARTWEHPEFPQWVQTALVANQLQPSRLVIEITESKVLQHLEGGIARMHQLKSLGVRLALDDFGVGFSSLDALRRYPVDILKVDRSFALDLGQQARAEEMLQSILQMGKALGLKVVIEGIERNEQLQWLLNAGAEWGQGFALAHPQAAWQPA